ncbi:MAG: hypothetical protein RLZZ597_973 [Cyanobacteriota bacterium]
MTLEVQQDEYAQALDNLPSILQDSYDKMKVICKTDPDFSYTNAVANRMRAFYLMQWKSKTFLGKRVAQSGSDFFVETILFFLKLFNDVESLNLEISSERPIERKHKAMRPDISVWRESDLLAVIECKTQLGWSRKTWKSDFEHRERELEKKFPNNVETFLVVMSSSNWPGFGEDPQIGKQLFCLLKNTWPTQLSTPPEQNMLYPTPIEDLFKQIADLSQV